MKTRTAPRMGPAMRLAKMGTEPSILEDPGKHQNNRVREDRPLWNFLQNLEDSIHQVIQQTYYSPELMR